MTANRKQAVIGVVVLSYNKRDDLLLALESIIRSEYPELHVVVVDNASSDGSADAVEARYPRFTLIRNPDNLGAAGGRNIGWRHLGNRAACDYVVFLDDDSEVAPSYFSEIAACFEAHPEAGVVAGKALTGVNSGVIMSAGIAVNLYTGFVGDIGVGEMDTGQFDQGRELQACGGFALAVKAAVLEELNGIDEQFNPYGWEEVDFCLRASSAGYKVRYEPQAVLCHKGSKAGRPPKAEYERHKVRNYFRLLGRHTNLVQKISCLFFVPVKCARVAWQMLRTGNARIIVSQARGFLDGLLKPAR
ncbi:MAG: glycosyltransferase family 2 protein [Pseudomonadota bacterium]|nr:glycosyltransferase family 2 protein [Pseudomonadota bacterium]